MTNFFDKIDGLTRKRSPYTAEEIEKARRKAKRTGRSFMEVLQESTGKSFDSTGANPSKIEDLTQSMGQILEGMAAKNSKSIQAMNEEVAQATASDIDPAQMQLPSGKNSTAGSSAQELCDATQKELEELQRRLERDFGAGISTADSSATSSADSSATPSDLRSEEKEAPVSIESFDGIEEVIARDVFGQDSFLKKLTIAFKRPFILPEEENHARNCFFLHGPQNSGKHYALQKLAQELKNRKILKSDMVYPVDLSRYTASGKDNIFLQDLYAALQSEAQIILFENFEGCHISYLSYISDLVVKGECYLQERYMLQQGQLIQANNAFTKETVSTFTAKGKYLAFLSVKNLEGLANVFGAPFVNALGDVCTCEALAEESWEKIAKVAWNQLLEKAKNQLFFQIQAEEEPILKAALAATAKNAGTKGLITFFDRLLKSLATLRLEGSYPKDALLTLVIEDGKLMAVIGEEKVDLMDHLPQTYSGDVAAVKAELDNIVGLTEIKKYILSLEEYYNTQKRRTEAGLKASDVSKHMIFTGNPGTGKTTIARIISRYLKAIGVLTGGQLVEVSRADLVGRFVGHTAPLVNQVVKSALGGVLFIDEAYSLYHGQEDSFGLEAIDTLVKAIEDHRENLIVILAGYSNEMETFLEANSGLKSRFPNIIDFPDYSAEELLSITKITVRSKGYVLSEEAEAPLLEFYAKVQEDHPDTAGNGRLVRNKVEEAILNQSRRLVVETEADLSLLLPVDFELSLSN